MFKVDLAECPSCGVKGKAGMMGVDGIGTPQTDDIGICGKCGAIHIITISDDTLELRKMDKKTWKEMPRRRRRTIKQASKWALKQLALYRPW